MPPVVAADDPDAVDRAAAALAAGDAIVIPTDTVYGLAVLPGGEDLLATLKDRPPEMPIAVLVGDAAAVPLPPAAAVLAEEFWPGPVTLVVPEPGAAGVTVGLRCPDHEFARALARRVGPLPTTSANRHGHPTPPTAAAAAAGLTGAPGLVVDGGPCGGVPSTVVDCTGERVSVLREGAVSTTAILAASTLTPLHEQGGSRMARSHRSDAAAHLSGVEFFKGFTDDELDRVAKLAEEIDADEGAELTDQGRPGQEAYVILEGRAGVYIGGSKKAEVGPGELIGEMALIDHRPRIATVRALTPMKLLAFDTERFRRLLDEMPKAQVKVMEILVDRLRALDLE
jgi:tRNA threonylcarbamoyl adenosine modification protein (Sua5/YciO/YrdC/YwlC family)